MAVCTALAVTGCKGGTATPYRIEADAASLMSLATDGALVARGAASGRTTSPFVRVHSSELGKELGDLASVLRSTRPEPEVAKERRRLIALAERASAALERLEHHPSDRALARRVHDVLLAAAKRAKDLGESV